jgi:hypothetical protein
VRGEPICIAAPNILGTGARVPGSSDDRDCGYQHTLSVSKAVNIFKMSRLGAVRGLRVSTLVIAFPNKPSPPRHRTPLNGNVVQRRGPYRTQRTRLLLTLCSHVCMPQSIMCHGTHNPSCIVTHLCGRFATLLAVLNTPRPLEVQHLRFSTKMAGSRTCLTQPLTSPPIAPQSTFSLTAIVRPRKKASGSSQTKMYVSQCLTNRPHVQAKASFPP